MKEKKEMCKNYYKGESGETKFSVVILMLILVRCFFQYDMIDCPIHVLFKCNKLVNKIQKRSIKYAFINVPCLTKLGKIFVSNG